MIALMSQTKLPDSSNPLSDIVGAVQKPYERFHDYIKETVENFLPDNIQSKDLSSIFIAFDQNGRNGWNSDDAVFLEKIDKHMLEDIMWTEINDERYRRQFIHSILLHPVVAEIEGKKDELRNWMIELLIKRKNEIPESKVPINMWLEDTKNLTENLF